MLGAAQTHLKSHFIQKDLQTTFTRLRHNTEVQERTINTEHHKMSLPAGTNGWRIKASLATTCTMAEPKKLFTEVKRINAFYGQGLLQIYHLQSTITQFFHLWQSLLSKYMQSSDFLCWPLTNIKVMQ